MVNQRDAQLLKAAVDKGLISQVLADDVAARAATEPGTSATELLLREGYLTAHIADALVPPTEALPDSIAGFRVLGELGQGGMGTVYRALQLSMHREVALKVIAPQYTADKAFCERFMREARTAGAVNHPNVITCYDVGQDKGRLYMALELMTGGDAAGLARRHGGRVPEADALRLVADCARGLIALRRAGLVHRDIKPANIFISADGVAKLADLGLARTGAGDDRLTMTGAAMGTPAFMPPEQAGGETALDVRTDLYALGATLFALTTGDTPYKGASAWAVVAKVLHDPVPDPRAVFPALSDPLAALVMKAMAKDRAARYQGPEELLEDVDALLAGRPPRHAAITAFASASTRATVVGLAPPDGGDATRPTGVLPAALAPTTPMPALQAAQAARAAQATRLARAQSPTAPVIFDPAQAAAPAQPRRRGPTLVAACLLVAATVSVTVIATRAAGGQPATTAPAAAGAASPEPPAAVGIAAQPPEPVPVATLAPIAPATHLEAAVVHAELPATAPTPTPAPAVTPQPVPPPRVVVAPAPPPPAVTAPAPTPPALPVATPPVAAPVVAPAPAPMVAKPPAPRPVPAVAPLPTAPVAAPPAPTPAFPTQADLDRASDAQQRLTSSGMACTVQPLPGGRLAVSGVDPTLRALPALGLLPIASLDLTGCARLADDLTALRGAPLTSLTLTGCARLESLAGIEQLPLQHLALDGCTALGSLKPLRGMQLTRLDCSACAELGSLAGLEGMPLTRLDLSGCASLDDDLLALRGMQLTHLDLTGCRSLERLDGLQGMPLGELSLRGCSSIEDLTPLIGLKLTQLDLGGCTSIAQLEPLRALPLTGLRLTDCDQFEESLAGLAGLALRTLDCTGCSELTSLEGLQGMPLEELSLVRCVSLRGDLTLLRGLPLQRLDLTGSTRLTSLDGLQQAPLKRLVLTDCRNLLVLEPVLGIRDLVIVR